MTWIEEIQQIGANLVSEFRRIADESESRVQAIEMAHSQNVQTLDSVDRVLALETRIPPSAL
jgi:two-component sensor histidine kinase